MRGGAFYRTMQTSWGVGRQAGDPRAAAPVVLQGAHAAATVYQVRGVLCEKKRLVRVSSFEFRVRVVRAKLRA